jgi:hypothetical protein
MNKIYAPCILVALTSFAFAQEGQQVKPTAAMEKYREYRYAATEPVFGLSKVKKLIKGIKADEEDNRIMAEKTYNALSVEEKFTYAMIHGENNSQNCDVMPWVVGEDKKIFGYFAGIFGDEAAWSDRQRSFLKNNRTKVVTLLRSTIKTRNRVGVNLKHAIMEIDAVELIPDVIAVYNTNKKDQDILTLLNLLMREGKYKPFLESATFTKLYGPDANYQASIEANTANQKLVISRATDFYKSRKK